MAGEITDRDIIAAQSQQIRDLEAQNAQRELDQAITGAIAQTGAGLIPGTEQQALTLLRSSVTTYTDASGRRVVGGPNLTPLKDHVAAQLSADLKHFVNGGTATRAANGAPVQPVGPPPSPDQGISAWIMHNAQKREAHERTTDARLDMSQPLGLPKRGAGSIFGR
jgi:hypothetical protein